MKTEKQCSKCNIVKPITDFRKNGNGWMGACKPCQYIYTQAHNKVNKEKYKKYIRRAVKKQYDKGQEFLNRHRALVGCRKCGDKRFWLIDYHHLDPKTKNHPIPYFKTGSIKVLKLELKKCITLCRNCHTDFHYKEKTEKITIEKYLKKEEL